MIKMKITKKMLSEVRKMKHGEQIMQHYKLYKFYQGKDKTKSDRNKKDFLILAGFKTTRK
jgi:hypothetical protein